MPFQDQALDDLRGILEELGEFAEDIRYQATSLDEPQAWVTIKALVEEGDMQRPLELGASGRGGPQPILVTLLRSATGGILKVTEGQDWLWRYPGTAQERAYRVMKIFDTEDVAAWRLYAVP